MKKTKLLLFLGILFLFCRTEATAIEKEESIIEFIGVRQGDKLIKADSEGIIHITANDIFYIEYKINNVDNIIADNAFYEVHGYYRHKQYGSKIKQDGYYSDAYRYFSKDRQTEYINITIYECKTEKSCNDVSPEQIETTLIDSFNIIIHFDFFDDLNIANSSIKIIEISQGNKVLTPTKMNETEYKVDVNDKEDIVYKFKGENFAENYNYTIEFSGMDKYIYSGKELNEGVTINLSQDEIKRITSDYELGIGASLTINDFYIGMIYGDDDKKSYVYLKIQEDEEIKHFETRLQYKNYKEIEIEFRSEDQTSFTDKYAVSPKYHDENNELVVLIKGTGYLDQDYDVEINITNNYNITLYNKKITLNGLEINNGYEVLLDDFVMDYPEEYEMNHNFYKIKTKIGNTTRNIDCYYGYNVAIISGLTYPNKKRALADGNFTTTDYLKTYLYIVNKNLFEINDKMYMTYIGKNFENDVIYEYELYYREDSLDPSIATLVTKSKISGLRLNTKGLQLEIENYLNDIYIEYVLVVKKEGQIIQIDLSRVEMSQEVSFANLELESRGKDIYLEVNNNKYIATKNAPLNVTINGIGFNDETVYDLPLNVKNTKDYYLDDPRYFKNYQFTGYELNNGLAKVILNSEDFYGYDDITVGFDISGEDLLGLWYYTFRVSYVDSKDLFKYVKKYIIDNTLDLIKNIEVKTTSETFQNNIEIADNGSIEVYDKNGQEKTEDYIGTGMIARINNEYERGVLDMDIVVKGDVTGDGEITITDIIKVRRHLANLNKLEGLYEMAGDTTDTGEITITDLMKLRLDLANIAELK